MNTSVNQEAFNWAFLNLLVQGNPAVNNWGRCSYITECDEKCAAGWLLKDNLSSDIYEAIQNVNWDQKLFAALPDNTTSDDLLIDQFKGIDQHFVRSMQIAHDSYAQHLLVSWKSNLYNEFKEVAKAFNLEMPFKESPFDEMQKEAIEKLNSINLK